MFGKTGGTGGSAGSMSFIAAEMTVTGNVGGPGSLHVDGRVEGDVNCTSLVVGNGGAVHGNITADEARIGGQVTGAVAAKTLTVDATARIDGDLSYDAVSIETGAQVEGRVKRLSRADTGGAQKLLTGD